MAAKNSVKIYAENTIYHVYNRGVEKRKIFLDEQDYKVFLSYLREYLSPPPKPEDINKKMFRLRDRIFEAVPRLPKNYFNQIDLLAYCLMPNHIHLLIRQSDNRDSIKEFTHSLFLRYSMYFNKKYNRVGSLFQGKYKAIIVMDESYLLHLSRYIHINPLEYTEDLINAYSSFAEYLGIRSTNWIKPDLILSYFENQNQKMSFDFKHINTYKKFVENYIKENSDLINDLKLE